MKKTLLVMAMAIALVLSMMAGASADDATIHSPADGELVYENTLQLAGTDEAAADNTVQWAVRSGTCARGTGTVAGNVDGFSDTFTWENGSFTSTLKIDEWEAGHYCFVLNTEDGEADGNRLTQEFYIVNNYAKVGGVIDLSGEEGPSKGNGTHAMEGVVGKFDDTVVGSITVNYRELDEYVTYDAEDLSFRSASGIGVGDSSAVADIETTDGGNILVLDRDASDAFPRGAIIVRPDGVPGTGAYEIDETAGNTGSDSWVSMLKGNNHVGTR